MRKTESRVQRAFEGIFGRTFKGFAQPVELAQKLVKEMDEGKVESLSRTYAPNRYIVYLCRRDREHFRSQEASLTGELESHLLQHARSQKYDLIGPPEVVIAADDDLKLGFFGIRAEPVNPAGLLRQQAARSRPSADLRATAPPPPLMAPPPPLFTPPPVSPSLFTPPPSVERADPQSTQGISAAQASELRLARRSLVLGEGTARREFQQGRVVVGRARDADYSVDDPNVSRRHAVLYWEGDQLFVKDLDSTNGTYVNGRPVTAGQLVDGDMLTVGNSEISVRVV